MKQGQLRTFFESSSSVITSLAMFFLIFNSSPCVAYEEIDLPDASVLSDPPDIYIKGGIIYYNGKITDTSYSEFLRLAKKSPINTVSINSIGGDARNALAIGDYIYKNGISVDVRSVCASACANYIFPAGKKKYLGNDSYLLWHGGINGPEREIKISGSITKSDFFSLREIKELQKDDVEFYRRIGVGNKLSFCPQLNSDYRYRFPEKWFSYTPADMKKFGITNIHYANSSSQWVISMRKKHVIFATYCN
ncbi:hypothetical protein F3J37_21750 [Pantoea sp. Al-1710]|uniref:Uncharacterized protein n=1 Tax=Candidatus Pantoea communis TaxID=2608354 RepID=A0ABX0RUN3_9GAMM|nr:hypothetical protein [Pantoea communis]NIG21300.1 hypothetical protein [Pantoea communis]